MRHESEGWRRLAARRHAPVRPDRLRIPPAVALLFAALLLVPSCGGRDAGQSALRESVEGLQSRNQDLRDRLAGLQPEGAYIVINTTLNRLQLCRSGQVLHEAVCSTGSNSELVSPDDGRRWFFHTPKGGFQVHRKMTAPLWVKPDWAFVEEGVPIPPPGAEERYEAGVLGMYGLYFGDGYLIHGTLFNRFLGQSVTHGCVRLGDEDLLLVYEASEVGTTIYIY